MFPVINGVTFAIWKKKNTNPLFISCLDFLRPTPKENSLPDEGIPRQIPRENRHRTNLDSRLFTVITPPQTLLRPSQVKRRLTGRWFLYDLIEVGKYVGGKLISSPYQNKRLNNIVETMHVWGSQWGSGFYG